MKRIDSYMTEMFYLICDECGEESEASDDYMLAIEEGEYNGWEVEHNGRVITKCLCPNCEETNS
ncbi:MAG: hypothetical protein PQJ59_16855 [Spirochaetales bacterium]|nr:hypothetical protein [Spirochaetales bacterium]